ncbi:MAG: hypothetical protein KIT17_13710 [Rubrivivax sp.]|nr:hypothetical protein [Rubrivivax sp.]
MTDPLAELKVRARLRLNARRGAEPDLRLRDCLNDVARDVGFMHWEHARQALGAIDGPEGGSGPDGPAGTDMGTFWHAPRCNSLLNPWFASLAEARAALAAAPAEAKEPAACAVLLPYRRQFVLAGEHYLRELGLDPHDPAWAEARHDLVRARGSAAWQALVMQRLKAPRETFAKAR